MSDIGITTYDQVLAERLRLLADWVEGKPTVARYMTSNFSTIHVYPSSSKWQDCLVELGKFEKASDASYLEARVELIPDELRVTLNMYKENTCTKVQTGVKEVTTEVYPEDVTPTIVTEIVPVYEYICPESWIKGK